jgi:ribonucleoside-diphosphate reductase alpha chain
LLNERSETGRIYIFNIDHANSHSSFLDKVNQSNLCVAPETQILTRDGYQPISELEDEYVDVWNGEDWSNVQVKKTSDNQELIKVVIDGEYLECTPYHKFYVVDKVKTYSKVKSFIEKRAYELQPGDKLIKYELPIIDGERELENAYTLGFHTGDGSYTQGKPILDLYGNKKQVLEHIAYTRYYEDVNNNRIRTYLSIPPHTKFVVPGVDYTIESRLKWFAGLVDSDGHIAKNGNTETIQIVSIHFDFLREVKYMLHTLGVNAKITNGVEAAMRLMPDGHGGQKEYDCKQSWRLLISNTGLARLCNLDFHHYTKKSNISFNIPNRNAERFNVVEDVIYTGRFDKTYCFEEPKRHMGMFNGFLTGQCVEITLPTKPIKDLNDIDGEIALCVLGAVNVGAIKSDKELEEVTELIVRGLDELIDFQDYVVPAAEKSTRARRSLGVGIIGLAHYFAKLGVSYEEQAAWDYAHELAESLQYYLLKASVNVAKEKGACDYFNRTKYSKGILPIDTYKKEVDEITNVPLKHDWEELRREILTYGLRHSTLSSCMPSESSSVTSNATNGIEPPKELLSVKRRLKQVVPQYSTLKNKYTTVWEMKSNKGYLNVAAALQKFFDQAISINWNYNPENYPDKMVPMSEIVDDWLYAYRSGAKTAYYLNTYDGAKEDKEIDLDELLNDNGEESCDGCTI